MSLVMLLSCFTKIQPELDVYTDVQTCVISRGPAVGFSGHIHGDVSASCVRGQSQTDA